MKWFEKLKVSTRLLISFILVLSLMLAMGAMSYFGIDSNKKETIKMLNTTARLAEYSQRLRANVNAMRRYEKDSFINFESREIEKVKDYYKKWKEEYDHGFEKIVLSEKLAEQQKEIEFLNRMKENFVSYSRGFDKVYARLLKGEFKTAQGANKAIDEYKDEIHATEKDSIEFAALKAKDMQKLSEIVTDSANRTIFSSVIFILISLGVSIAVSILISRSITKQLGGEPADVVNIAKRIADGDMTVTVKVNSNDTSSALAAMRNMVEGLEQMVSEIVIGAQNLSQAVQEIASGNETLSQRTSEQASSLEEVASTIEEATASIRQNAENSVAANKIAVNSSHMAEDGGRVVGDAVAAINDVSQFSKKIGEIISVINEIAFQTNLLALNAAVEAARAGEQGRGFAVVAGEVRNLAQRAASSSKEINQLIQVSMEKVSLGTDLANKSGEALKEIIQSVKSVGQMVEEISAASEEQKRGIDQINIAISELDTMTQQNAALVEETASAGEEMANQSQEFILMMNKFKIREEVRDAAQSRKHKELHLHTVAGMGSAQKIKDDGNGRTRLAAAAHKVDGKEIKNILTKEGFEEF